MILWSVARCYLAGFTILKNSQVTSGKCSDHKLKIGLASLGITVRIGLFSETPTDTRRAERVGALLANTRYASRFHDGPARYSLASKHEATSHIFQFQCARVLILIRHGVQFRGPLSKGGVRVKTMHREKGNHARFNLTQNLVIIAKAKLQCALQTH